MQVVLRPSTQFHGLGMYLGFHWQGLLSSISSYIALILPLKKFTQKKAAGFCHYIEHFGFREAI